ncbi:MAG TPA: hypothetical protein ACFYEK_07415 [Candidatus Wunengus sp. YC60]|uniref:hypothetical protein n=1 Tax=Candidatus Wunengus sp. YC60 TaxID=3367697 RepID=UPI00402A2C79
MNKQSLLFFILFFVSQSLFTTLQNAYTQPTQNTSQQTVRTNININASTTYKDVFVQFGDNAVRLYQQYGTFALEFLKEYKIEGLALLEKYGREMANLHPLLDYRDIFHLYSNPDNNINNLNIFSPETLSLFYKTFGDEGVKYVASNPENFFLINEDKDKGMELINLANEKGDVVFPLARKHGIAFAKLYDKDVLNIVIKFQEDGLLAIKEYGERSKIIFNLFIDDDTFYHVIKTYGHKQTIPIIYLFYDNKDFNSYVYDYLKKTKVYEWASSWWYGADTTTPDTQTDAATRRENARRAVNLIFELGNDFLDRFEILDINNVKEESITTITNKLRNFFISDVEKVSRKRIRHEDITFQDKLFAGLDILGFVPIGSGISKGAKLATKGARFARTTKGFKGLINLTEDLVKTYGDDAVQFVAKYGDDGIKALKATDGKILKLSQQYGDDVVRYVSKYGVDAGTAIERYGNNVLSLARQYGDDVIRYTALYGDDGLRIIQKHGKDIVLLSSVYGDNVIKMAALHGDGVISYVSKYGSSGIKVIEKYGDDVIRLAKRHGDDVIKYVGMYGDDGLKLARKGKAGLFVMRFMPPKIFAKCVKFIKYGLIATIFLTIATHPIAFLSGLINALAWLFGTSPILIAIILGLVASFFIIRFLKKFKWFFTPFLVCFKIMKRFI